MSVIKITSQNFDEIKGSNKKVLIDFYADWCGPCRMLSPTVDEIAEENADIIVGKINVDDEPSLAQQFGVMSIPTLVVLKDGVEIQRSMGVRPKAQLLALLED
jgi:thioredoxin 1